MPKKNIAIITGTRAEFGIWTPILQALDRSKKLNLQLIVTGMHLQKQFGYTLDQVKSSNIPIAAEVTMYKDGGTPADSLARGTANLAYAFSHLKPDLVMLLGDRLEMLAAANAALACQLPIAHLHGGETAPGTWDEQIRHAITKMSHLHFCTTETARHRIVQMGEDPRSIHLIGAPALDWANVVYSNLAKWVKRTHRAAVLLHPSSPDDTLEQKRTALLLKALRGADIPLDVYGSNNDPGHHGIFRAYDAENITVTMSVPQGVFWNELLRSSLLIGNSSSGIIESATFGIPTINLGDRQAGRERNPNVIDVPWSAGARGIQRAIQHALTQKSFLSKVAKRKNLYGDGHAAERLIKVLESLPFPLATTKRFFDA